jgi:hypothetical protein
MENVLPEVRLGRMFIQGQNTLEGSLTALSVFKGVARRYRASKSAPLESSICDVLPPRSNHIHL